MEQISKNKIKNSILKYSNLTLFERREKQYKSDKKLQTKTPKLFKINKLFHKKVEKTKENTLFQFCQTMSSFHSSEKSSTILPLLDYFDNNNKTKKNRKKNYHKLSVKIKNGNQYHLNKNDKKSKTLNNFYITETSTIKAGNKPKIKNLSILFNKNKDNKKADLNIDTLLLIQTFRDNENNNNNNNKLTISNYFPHKKKPYLKNYSYIKPETNINNFEKTIEEKDIKRLLNSKISKYNYYKQPRIKDFIKKTQELKIQSYSTKIKKERAIRLEEGYYNQIEFYQDTMNSLQSAKKLLDVQFSNKIADYTRFVISKREREIVTSSKLIQEIINYRKDIEHIKTKIGKIEIEKSNIIKWIYFMIQMKEKKLVLPNYYKIILEKGIQKRLSIKQGTRKEDKEKKDTINRSKTKKKSYRRASFYFVENLIFNNNNNKDNSNNINENEVNRKEEYEKIMNYKNELIFQTPEDFQDRLSGLQKENLLLLKYNNELNNQVFILKRELDSLNIDKRKIDLGNNQIRAKEKELENIKNITEEKIRLISDFKKNEKILEEEYKKERAKGIQNKRKNKKSQSSQNIDKDINEKNNNINENKKTLLYRKINIIFETSKTVGSKLKFSTYILNLLSKKIYTKEKEMTLMLEFVEQTIDYLINNLNYYMNQNEEIQDYIKNVKSDIEREHKIDKARIQMMLDLQKIKLLKEKVEKRSNKIYFLPSKKIDLSKFKLKKEKKIIDNYLDKIPTIEDYLYNEKESNNK